jgi:hypothetical protein
MVSVPVGVRAARILARAESTEIMKEAVLF